MKTKIYFVLIRHTDDLLEKVVNSKLGVSEGLFFKLETATALFEFARMVCSERGGGYTVELSSCDVNEYDWFLIYGREVNQCDISHAVGWFDYEVVEVLNRLCV